jgi:hypothetical protein
LVTSGAERRTELLGKYVMGDAAQYGLQRFIPNLVVPVALAAVQVDQWALVSRTLASAQVMTNVLGLTTVVPVQVKSLTLAAGDAEALCVIGMATSAPARASAMVMEVSLLRFMR